MFAGDKFKPAADASYRNFNAGPTFNIGSNVFKEIGTIDSLGPFHVHLDLIIHSFKIEIGSSLLAFRGNGATCDNCKIGDRVPALFLDNKHGFIQFSNNVQNLTDSFLFKIKLNHWYNITIEQKPVNVNVSDKTEN